MAIQFLCPNGHRISCPDEQAGRAAKCPRCGVKFRIPELSEMEMSDSDSDVSRGELEVAHDSSEQIEFLCPNGHRLHGPASLQGKPGQCPECGSKFRVPSYDEVPEEGEEEQAEQQIEVGRADGLSSGLDLEGIDEDEDEDWDFDETADGTVPWARIFARLWRHKAQGAVIEIQLGDGLTITPEHFASKLSQGAVAVFGTDEIDATHTVITVPWASIKQIVARGLSQLPGGMQ